MATSHAFDAGFAHTLSATTSTRSVPQTESLAGAVLSVLPAVYGVTLLLPVLGYDWDPVGYAIIGLSFYLATVALAAVDEYRLRQDGVEAASAYWALLTAVPYLLARTRVLIDKDRPGLALLWIAISTSIATATCLWLVSAA